MLPSFTSPSKGLPSRVILLAFVAVAALAGSIYYSVGVNPEVRYFTRALHLKRDYAQKMHEEQGRAVIVCGGSATLFSVNGEYMLDKYRLPVVNFGMHAGMGAQLPVAVAADQVREGDTLVLACEPELLMKPFSLTDLQAQMGAAAGSFRFVNASNVTGEQVHWVDDVSALRPGLTQMSRLLFKMALGKRLYRFREEDIRPSGYAVHEDVEQFRDPLLLPGNLSDDGRTFLKQVKSWGQEQGVEVVVSVPWSYITPENEARLRRMNVTYVREVSAILPVLKESDLKLKEAFPGVHPVREDFTDTNFHMTQAGARRRSDALGTALQRKTFWTDKEIGQLEKRVAEAP
jgi:hypothetical protein